MVWIFALLMGLALVFFKLGSASVWAGILTFGLKLSLFLLAFFVIAFFWQKIKAQCGNAENL